METAAQGAVREHMTAKTSHRLGIHGKLPAEVTFRLMRLGAEQGGRILS